MEHTPTDFMDLRGLCKHRTHLFQLSAEKLRPVVMPGIKPKAHLANGGAGVVSGSTSVFRKLDDDVDGAPKVKKVDPTSRQALIRARVDKGLTQDQADTLCNFPKHTFKAIENGTAFLAKLKMP